MVSTETIAELVFSGIKKSIVEIIAAILLTVLFWVFPKLKAFFKYRTRSINSNYKHFESESQENKEIQRQDKHPNRLGEKHYGDIIFSALMIIAICILIVFRPFNNKPYIESTEAEKQYELGKKYYEARNYKQAVYWYRKAAEQGNVQALYSLGDMYNFATFALSEGTQPFDPFEAAKWYIKAAQKGYAPAQYSLGNLYFFGFIGKDYSKAERWYRKAAEQEYAPAQFSLGDMYREGEGVQQNYLEAVKWYRKAAELGNSSAQYALGDMYENGYGVSKDLEEANKWHIKALNSGYVQISIRTKDYSEAER